MDQKIDERKQKGARQRSRIVAAAASAFRRQGYAATGVAEIIALSQAPKGSVYHYFPHGKDEIAVAALKYAGDKALETLRALAQRKRAPAKIALAYGALLRGWMQVSDFRDGCPVATTVLEAAADKDEIAAAGAQALRDWARFFGDLLIAEGVAPKRAHDLGRLAIMLFEGALIEARARRDGAAITLAAKEAARLFQQALK
jgi:TetR/AcrR family transcriptional repressor of lmrAB and yxaGH operons